ncbi:hypothetical protein QUB33_05970 [Microcoleus sp. B3-A4]|uniref:hypothetical protein n=1 Tax=Microcoleus sp. B3-A4 TaxID=2818653 RepID=UPI002FD287C3
MTIITVNQSSFQVEPFLRYKENRVKGHFTLEGLEFPSLNMAIVKINPRILKINSVLGVLPVTEVWGFVINDSGGTLSTFVTAQREFPSIEPDKIYEFDFLPFKSPLGKGFMLNTFPRNLNNDHEKFGLEIANDILTSAIDYCRDERLDAITLT